MIETRSPLALSGTATRCTPNERCAAIASGRAEQTKITRELSDRPGGPVNQRHCRDDE
jgi:hypothetical protein